VVTNPNEENAMFRKLAVAAVLSAALSTSALASQRGLAEAADCTHCLPGAVTGGSATVARGRVPVGARPEAPVAVGDGQAVAGKVARAEVKAGGRVVVDADCRCAKGECPVHAKRG
jgi:hypothetical protein